MRKCGRLSPKTKTVIQWSVMAMMLPMALSTQNVTRLLWLTTLLFVVPRLKKSILRILDRLGPRKSGGCQ